MSPDKMIFQEHVASAAFQVGVDDEIWGVLDDDADYPTWPFVVIWVKAAEKVSKPGRYYFRFDLSGYPGMAPSACPWDITTGTRLDNSRWPAGGKFVSSTFNFGWNPNALYAPCDRAAMPGHEGWQQQFPDLWWQPSFKIMLYLHFIHRLLNSSDYAKS